MDIDRLELDKIELSSRAQRACQALGVRTIGELRMFQWGDIIKLQGIGHKTLNEIQETLCGFGVSLRDWPFATPKARVMWIGDNYDE